MYRVKNDESLSTLQQPDLVDIIHGCVTKTTSNSSQVIGRLLTFGLNEKIKMIDMDEGERSSVAFE